MLDGLRKIAENEKISLNTLVSIVFDQYLNWNYTATKANFIPLPKTMLIKIFDKLDDDEIIDIANYVVDEQMKSLMFATRRAYTIEDFMKGVEYWAKISNFHSSHVEKPNNVHQYIIQHDMGKRWSFYYKRIFEGVFAQLDVKKTNIDTTQDTLILTLTHL
jgi:Lhr-like helicase